jgi:hypothetical protein
MTLSETPLVSVVTPSFNQAQFLGETLRSVELQQHRPIHHIVIDGGSADGTVQLLEEWSARDHGPDYSFEWISERDRGHADAMNKGFDRVKGDIVGWINSDDPYYDRAAVSDAVAAFRAHPGVDVVHGEVAMLSENGGLQMIWCFPQFDYGRALRGYIIPQPTVFFRRCITDEHRLDPTLKLAIDHIYWLQIGREHRFLKLPKVLAADRDHHARISQVSKTELSDTGQQFCAAYGGCAQPPLAARLSDAAWRAAMRLKGLAHVAAFFAAGGVRQDNLACEVWTDGFWKTAARQLTMRVGARTEMRPRSGEREYRSA